MVIGDPIEHSLSPLMHNIGYEALGIEAKFTYFASRVKINDLADFIKGLKAMNIRGVSCTIPHKNEVIKYIDEIDDIAQKIGAVNTIVNDDGLLKGYNTDWQGIIKPLEKITLVKNKTVALIGAGGAARAAAYAVAHSGAKLQIYNRTLKKAEELTREFGGSAHSTANLEDLKNADIIINATSVGLYPLLRETPVPKKFINKKHIVFDLVYTPYETQLLKDAREQGAEIIHGVEMFIYQGAEQFKLYTGHDAPVKEMRKAVIDKLTVSNLSSNNKFCLPIIKKNENEILEIIHEHIGDYRYFEIWLDYIENLDIQFISELSTFLKERAIFLFRRKNLEKIKLNLTKRKEIISLLSKMESYLDLDIIQQKEELDYIKNNNLNLKMIVSYHNYHETPSYNKLLQITDIIIKYDPTILKISTICDEEGDLVRMLNLLLDLQKKTTKYIVSGMGEKGKIVKILGALWGNAMTFVPLNSIDASAPGQITKTDFENILDILNK